MCLASILICVSVFKSSCGRHSSPDDVRQRGNLSFDSQMLHRPPPLADSALEALIPQRWKVSAGATVGASLSLADSLNLNPPSAWWFTRSCLNRSAVCAWRPPKVDSRDASTRWREYVGFPEDLFCWIVVTYFSKKKKIKNQKSAFWRSDELPPPI